jgi:phosphoglycolate phosphatase
MRSVTIRLACLDMAGTTVTDEGVVERSFVEAMVDVAGVDEGELGGVLDIVRRTMGQSKIDVFRRLLPDEATAVAANTAFERAYERAVARREVTAVPGAERVMRTLRRAGVQVCLITGFAPSTREALIDALSWRLLVDLALSPADVGRGRPEPDLVLAAAERLGVPVGEIAVFGDTVSDLLCGSRAGAAVVGAVAGDADRRAELAAAPHTHVVSDIGEILPIVLPEGAGGGGT